jgi:hypothetical protein
MLSAEEENRGVLNAFEVEIISLKNIIHKNYDVCFLQTSKNTAHGNPDLMPLFGIGFQNKRTKRRSLIESNESLIDLSIYPLAVVI